MTALTNTVTIERPSQALVDTLTAERNGPCVTILLQREFAGDASDSIRLKNAIRSAQEALSLEGVEAAHAESILGMLTRLADDRALWQPGEGGIAVYVADGLLRIVEVPEVNDPLIEAGPSFLIKPLLRALQDDATFYVLALSLGNVRLLRCGANACEHVEVPDMPTDISEGPRQYKDDETTNQFRTADRPGGGVPGAGRTSLWHGQGVGTDDDDVDRREFFRAVGKALQRANLDAPLVLACDRQHRRPFLEHAGLDNVWPEGPDGNPDHLSDQDLHDNARPYIESGLAEQRRESIDRLRAGAAHGKTASTVEDCLNAARDGRAEILLVQGDAEVWGRLGDDRAVALHTQRTKGDTELTNETALLALRNGGDAILVDDLPSLGLEHTGPTVALLRW